MTGWLLDTLFATSALMVLVLIVRDPVRRRYGARAAYLLWLLPALRAAMPPLVQYVERPAAQPAAPLAGAVLPSAPAVPLIQPPIAMWEVSDLLLGTWIVGALAMLLVHAIAYWRLRREVLGEGRRLAHLGRIAIVRSEFVSSPIGFGILSPVIAVPADFEARYSPAERRAALAHERAHHLNGDLVANLFAFVLLSLQWFNPLAWASYRAFRLDQEAACDARVLDVVDDRAAYGRAIAKTASSHAFLAVRLTAARSTLKWRLEQMTNPKEHTRKATIGVIALTAVALPLTATRAIEYIDASPVEQPVRDAPSPLPERVSEVDEVQWQDEQPQPVSDGQPDREVVVKELSVEERVELEQSLAELRMAQVELADQRGQINAEMRAALTEARKEVAQSKIEMNEAQREMRQALAEIDENAAELRAQGIDPAKMKASIRSSMASLAAIDMSVVAQTALSALDPTVVEQSLAQSEAELRRAIAETERKLGR